MGEGTLVGERADDGSQAGNDAREETAFSRVDASALRTVELTSGNAVHLSDTPLSDDCRYEGFLDDFHHSVELWNCGDYAACVPLFEKLAAAGDATAQYNMGVCYRDALGVARNKALKAVARKRLKVICAKQRAALQVNARPSRLPSAVSFPKHSTGNLI